MEYTYFWLLMLFDLKSLFSDFAVCFSIVIVCLISGDVAARALKVVAVFNGIGAIH